MRTRAHQVVGKRAVGPDGRVHGFAREYTLCAEFRPSQAGRDAEPGDDQCPGCVREGLT